MKRALAIVACVAALLGMSGRISDAQAPGQFNVQLNANDGVVSKQDSVACEDQRPGLLPTELTIDFSGTAVGTVPGSFTVTGALPTVADGSRGYLELFFFIDTPSGDTLVGQINIGDCTQLEVQRAGGPDRYQGNGPFVITGGNGLYDGATGQGTARVAFSANPPTINIELQGTIAHTGQALPTETPVPRPTQPAPGETPATAPPTQAPPPTPVPQGPTSTPAPTPTPLPSPTLPIPLEQALGSARYIGGLGTTTGRLDPGRQYLRFDPPAGGGSVLVTFAFTPGSADFAHQVQVRVFGPDGAGLAAASGREEGKIGSLQLRVTTAEGAYLLEIVNEAPASIAYTLILARA